MKGLVKKDLLSFYHRQSKFSLVFIALVYIVCILILKRGYGLYSTVLLSFPMMASGLVVNLVEMDGKCNFDRYAIALPLTKTEIVKSRYVCFLTYCMGSLVLMLVITCIYYGLHHAFSFELHLLILCYGLALLILFGSISVACAFVYGVNGSSLAMLLTLGIFIGGFLCISFFEIDVSFLWTTHPFLVWGVFFILSLLVLYGCYRISVRAYIRQHV